MAVLFGLAIALAAYGSGRFVLQASSRAQMLVSVVLIAAGASVVLVDVRFAKPHLLWLGALIAGSTLLGHCGLGTIWGDELARSAAEYAHLPRYSYYAALIASWTVFVASACVIAALMVGENWLQWMHIGSWAGAVFAAIAALLHTASALLLMKTGLNFSVPILSQVVLWGLISPGAAYGFANFRSRPVYSWVGVVVIILSAAGYSALACRGASAYFALKKLHSDAAYVYVHFRNENTWHQTFDDSGSVLRLERCRKFLTDYPFCAYRPAAMTLLAETEFELWKFDQALRTAHRVRKRYKHLNSLSSIIGSLAAYTSGSPEQFFSVTQDSSFLQRWSTTYGALIAAAAAERAGCVRRALGSYNSYAEFLSGLYPTGWHEESLAYARANANRMHALIAAGHDKIPRGTVVGRVILDGRPVAGIRIVLVRPHPDAALPSESKQFRGAWSIPAWSGMCAVSGRDGSFRLARVPYAEYEVVVGLPAQLARRGIVIASSVKPVTVHSDLTSVQEIRLVPAIKQLSPVAGSTVSTEPLLVWKPYPGAAYYSVSVLSVDRHKPGSAAMPATCWARTHIRDSFTRVTSAYFANGSTSLEKGGVYTWTVYAYGKDGKLISSSEHYGQLHEPDFRVR